MNSFIPIVKTAPLNKSLRSIFIIALILLARKSLNLKSFKKANKILWGLLFIYLILPYSFVITLDNQIMSYLGDGVFSAYESAVYYRDIFLKTAGTVLYKRNRVIVASLLLIYCIFQIVKIKKALNGSKLINDLRIEEYINSFNLKRNVSVCINDNLKTPITYGLFKPQIILQSKILEDEKLLKYVILHEMTHIKNFDCLWNHLKYLILCFYWYHIPFFATMKYVEEDLEILCDKLVIEKAGDCYEHRKEYLEVMMELSVPKKEENFTVKLNPNIERMRVMTKYKLSLSGIITFILVFMLSMTAFANIEIEDENQVVSSAEPVDKAVLNEDNRVEIIDEEEYQNLELKDNLLQNQISLNSVDLDTSDSIEGEESKSYKFNMSSWNTYEHDGFTVRLSNMKCRGGVEYNIVIKENNRILYNESFNKATTLKVKAKENNNYTVIITNTMSNTLKYDIEIYSYVR